TLALVDIGSLFIVGVLDIGELAPTLISVLALVEGRLLFIVGIVGIRENTATLVHGQTLKPLVKRQDGIIERRAGSALRRRSRNRASHQGSCTRAPRRPSQQTTQDRRPSFATCIIC